MKGNISLGDFIQQVKRELVSAQDSSDGAFLLLKEVELEVSFVLDASASAEGQLLVVKLGGETKATQTHKAVLKFTPLPRSAPALATDGPAYSVSTDGPGRSKAPLPAAAAPVSRAKDPAKG